VDATDDLGVVDLVTGAVWGRQRTVAEGNAAWDVFVARNGARAHEAREAREDRAGKFQESASRYVYPALTLLANAALLRLLAAHLR